MIIVAAILSTAANLLKPYQEKNIRVERIQAILTSADISSTKANADTLFKQYIVEELVLDPETRRPAPDHASYIANRIRDHGILISTDGPDHNVLKMKPPIVFDEDDADRLVDTLEKVLQEDCLQMPPDNWWR